MRQMLTHSRAVANDVQNVLDYLLEAELALYTNGVDERPGRVTFHRYDPTSEFILDRSHPGIEQYRRWVEVGAYSAVLPDASLIQLTYDIAGREIAGHRLAYIPCPFQVDSTYLLEGQPILDVVDMYREQDPLMRSPLRFDFDPKAAKPGHPAAHLTINGMDCRVACVAPIHPLRFVDFVFRHFYTALWAAHDAFFSAAAYRHFGKSVLADPDRTSLHITWDVHAKSSSG